MVFHADEITRKVLDWEQILELLSREASGNLGCSRIKSWPLNLPELEREELHQLIKELRHSVEEEFHPHLQGIESIESLLVRVGKEEVLSGLELYQVGQLADAYRAVREQLYHRSDLALWHDKFEDKAPRSWLKNWEVSLNSSGELLDDASSLLRECRHNIRSLKSQIEEELQLFLSAAHFQKMLQENFVTFRDGRPVVPVKADFRGEFPGWSVASSGSGATVFMEPHSVAEKTNRLRWYEGELKQEEFRIRKEMSRSLAEFSALFLLFEERLTLLDSTWALTRFLVYQRGSLATYQLGKDWFRGTAVRHPLLGDEAVGLDLHLEASRPLVIVSGANTGGKTVTLKTVGVTVMMARAGFPVLAQQFDLGDVKRLEADLGDGQDVQSALSTFSAKLKRYQKVLEESAPGTLVLLDELGTGTDAEEGGCLAIAILEKLAARGAAAFVTTHSHRLKHFAQGDPRFLNVAMGFDPETYYPTFRLEYGQMGASHAIQIAKNLGLSKDLIERSWELMGTEAYTLEKLREELEERRSKAELMEQELEERQHRVVELEAAMEEARVALQQAENSMLTEQAKAIEAQGKAVMDKVHGIIRHFTQQMKEEGDAPQELSQLEPQKLKEEVQKELESIAWVRTVQKRNAEQQKQEIVWSEGMKVHHNKYGKDGVILKVRKDKAEVQFGQLRLKVPFEELTPREVEAPQVTWGKRPSAIDSSLPQRLDLRGFRVEDGLFEVDKHIDLMQLQSGEEVEIIHGKGTGALRAAIHELLRDHPAVAEFICSEQQAGGTGVTIVKLKQS